MPPAYRYTDHTAEIGIVAEGRTLPEAFAAIADGLLALLYDPECVEAREERSIEVFSTDMEGLLVDWLNEVNYLVEVEGFAFRGLEVLEVRDDRLRARGVGEPLDPERHRAKEQVKAATYHDLEVAQGPEGWRVRVVLDV